MKILVLGGTGAMGVDLVKILAKRGDNVTVTSRSERKSESDNVKYVKGDAHDTAFLKSVLSEKYDAIVDFMVYNTKEFKARYELLLNVTNQYVFLSSSRVYADSEKPITEDSPRLSDATTDSEYLKTDEYALTKARQENILRRSGKTNWTIIRPYITYSDQRLQLGVYEKELWLYRALHDKTIVFPKAIAEKYTTMTLGADVAMGISKLIGNKKAMGEAFHIATDKAIKWNDVLAIYKKVFNEVTGKKLKIKYADDPKPIYEAMGNKYQVIYDRLFDRRFDNTKFLQAVGEFEFVSLKSGLEKCLTEFLNDPVFRFVPSNAFMDKLAGEKTRLSEISGMKKKCKYLAVRYLPMKVILFIKACKRKIIRSGEKFNAQKT